MRTEKKRVLVLLLLFVFLASNVNNIWIGNVNAALISSQSSLVTGQRFVSNQGNLAISQAPTTTNANNCALSDFTLTVTKQVLDPQGLNGLSNTIQFPIIINIYGVPSTLFLSNGQSTSVCVPAGGSFSVVEDIVTQPVGFQFTSALSGPCSGNANSGQSGTCTITNTILQTDRQTTPLVTPQGSYPSYNGYLFPAMIS